MESRGLAPMPGIRAVIWDCDGVMFDSADANRAYYNAILKEAGKPPMTDEQSALGHMMTARQTLEMLFPDPEELARVWELRRRVTYAPFVGMMVIEPGFREVLEEVRKKYRTAVCTNRTNTMHQVLEEHGLEGLFDVVVTSRDVENPKPHPEPLWKAARDLGLDVTEALYVGDSTVDAEAARAAGMPFAAYRAPDLGAERHLARHEDLLRLLAG